MVRITIDLDDKVYEAVEQKAQARGLEARALLTAVVEDQAAMKEPSFVSTPPEPVEWAEFFAWLNGLHLQKRYHHGSREDLYVR